jgi:hypothetical protein
LGWASIGVGKVAVAGKGGCVAAGAGDERSQAVTGKVPIRTIAVNKSALWRSMEDSPGGWISI